MVVHHLNLLDVLKVQHDMLQHNGSHMNTGEKGCISILEVFKIARLFLRVFQVLSRVHFF